MNPDVINPAIPLAAADPAPARGRSSAPPRKAWIAALPQLLRLRHAYGADDAPGWLAACLALLVFAAWTGVDRLQAGPDVVFYVYSMPAVAWYGLLLLSTGILLATLSSPGAPVRAVLATVFALALVYLGLLAALIVIEPSRPLVTAVSWGFLAYVVVVLSRTLRSYTGRGQPRAMTLGVLFLFGAGYLTDLLYVDPSMWYAPEEESSTAYDEYWDRGEGLLFEQPARIDSSVAAVAPASDGVPEVFFLGFAGYGEERVFAEEIKLAADVVADRYGSGDRSVLLVNDRRDLDSNPIATAVSLEYALQALAGRMNVDEDVLFLALSSHGTEGSLAVSHGPMMLHNLTDEMLADALRDSGIRWRVVVISACHSGSFIDALRGPETIVITAAAPDRTSFGCSDERELTYFGEAFYRDALPAAPSLREAFYAATASIARREKKEEIRASKPQAHFGEALERQLAGHFTRP